jgi:hypothetical protein
VIPLLERRCPHRHPAAYCRRLPRLMQWGRKRVAQSVG